MSPSPSASTRTSPWLRTWPSRPPPTAAPAPPWRASWPRPGTCSSATCPWGCGGGPRSPSPSPTTPTCWSWTSRPPGSTRWPGPGCGRPSGPAPSRAPGSWSPPTTWPRPSSATAWSCSPPAGWRPPAPWSRSSATPPPSRSAPPAGRPPSPPSTWPASRSAWSAAPSASPAPTWPPSAASCPTPAFPPRWPASRPASRRPSSSWPPRAWRRPAAGSHLAEQQGPLHFLDGLGDLDPPGAGVGAVEGGPAAPDPLLVVEHGQPLAGALVAGVEDEAVGVDDRRRPEVLLVGPEHRARGGAGGAQDALGGVVEALAFGGGLAPLGVGGRVVVDQERQHLAVAGEERLHVDQQVLADRQSPQRLHGDLVADLADQHLAGQPVGPVDEHGVRPADPVGAGAPEG